MFKQSILRWLLLGALVLALILIPFFLFGEQIESWTNDFVHSAAARPGWVALVLGLLLAVDILLPIPSSFVSTTTGFMLGFVGGTLTSLAGMTISCTAGFWLALKIGRPLTDRLVGNDELQRLENLQRRIGDWVIIVSRPVPVLAEASVLFAGTSRMPFYRFLLLATLSNLGISAGYAAVGAFSATVDSFLLAFGGAILLPALAMFVMRKNQPKNNAPQMEDQA